MWSGVGGVGRISWSGSLGRDPTHGPDVLVSDSLTWVFGSGFRVLCCGWRLGGFQSFLRRERIDETSSVIRLSVAQCFLLGAAVRPAKPSLVFEDLGETVRVKDRGGPPLPSGTHLTSVLGRLGGWLLFAFGPPRFVSPQPRRHPEGTRTENRYCCGWRRFSGSRTGAEAKPSFGLLVRARPALPHRTSVPCLLISTLSHTRLVYLRTLIPQHQPHRSLPHQEPHPTDLGRGLLANATYRVVTWELKTRPRRCVL